MGTRRPSLLNDAHIDTCVSLLEHNDVDNFESRMAAEVRLYWIILKKCSASEVNLVETEAALEAWNGEWSALFSESIWNTHLQLEEYRPNGFEQTSHALNFSKWDTSSPISTHITNH